MSENLGYSSSWFRRNLDPSGVQQDFANYWNNVNMQYNALEAEKARTFSASEAQKAREFNALESEKNRAFQANMSNTSYIRAFNQLRELGLNPYEFLKNGGASTPSGSVLGAPAAHSAQASSSSHMSFDGSATSKFTSSLLSTFGKIATSLIGTGMSGAVTAAQSVGKLGALNSAIQADTYRRYSNGNVKSFKNQRKYSEDLIKSLYDDVDKLL